MLHDTYYKFGVGVGVSVGVTVTVGVGNGLAVGVGVLVGVFVGAGVGDGVRVAEGIAVGVTFKVTSGAPDKLSGKDVGDMVGVSVICGFLLAVVLITYALDATTITMPNIIIPVTTNPIM